MTDDGSVTVLRLIDGSEEESVEVLTRRAADALHALAVRLPACDGLASASESLAACFDRRLARSQVG